MSKRMQIVLCVCMYVFFSCFCGCYNFEAPYHHAESKVILSKGTDNFLELLSQLDTPKGIVPDFLNVPKESYPDIVLKSPIKYHEFFVFDRQQCVLLLSADPIYYMIIKAPEFYRHLLSEYDQIMSGASPNTKRINTTSPYKVVGPYEAGIFFIPKEMKYYRGRLQDSISTTFVDPFRLYGAAEKLWFYTPVFQEETLYRDFYDKWQHDQRSVVQHTRVGKLSERLHNHCITYHINQNILCNFSVIIGEHLRLTAELLGTEEQRMTDQQELTRDFSVFISTPLGNPQDAATAYLSDRSSSGRHGICVILRGDQSYIKDFIAGENIDLSPESDLPLSLFIKDNYSSGTIELNWMRDTAEMDLWIKGEDEEYGAEADAVVSGRSYTVDGLRRGCAYTIRLTEKDKPTSILAEKSFYVTDLLFTEIAYWGSSYPGTLYDNERMQRGSNSDDWVEITNISQRAVDLSDLILYYYNSNNTRISWFSPYKTENYAELNGVVQPGERIIISNDRADEYFFADYELPPGIDTQRYIRGTKTGVSLGESYSLELVRDDTVLHAVDITGEYGDKAPFKTMVMDRNGAWQTSTQDSGTHPETPLGSNTEEMLFNFCTPGYAAGGEL